MKMKAKFIISKFRFDPGESELMKPSVDVETNKDFRIGNIRNLT